MTGLSPHLPIAANCLDGCDAQEADIVQLGRVAVLAGAVRPVFRERFHLCELLCSKLFKNEPIDRS